MVFVVGHVGDGVEQLLQFPCGFVHFGLEGLVGFLQLGNARLCRFGLVLAALLHQLAYLLGGGVYFGQVRVELHLGGLPPVIERQYLPYGFAGAVEMLLFQSAYYRVGILCNLSDGKHIYNSV